MPEKNSIITVRLRAGLAKLLAGEINTLPPITHFALGDGGANAEEEPVAPTVDQTALTHEICRYAVADVKHPVETTARFTVEIPEADHAGVKFNELALVDSGGEVAAIRTMYQKRKDGDMALSFTFDLEF